MDGAGQVRPARSRHAVRAAVHVRPRRATTSASGGRSTPCRARSRASTTSSAAPTRSGSSRWRAAAQMGTLPRLQPRVFYDLVVEVALIRPGPIQGGAVHPFVRRKLGRRRSPTCTRSSSRCSSAPWACRSSRSSSCRSRWRWAAARARTPTCCAARWAPSAAWRRSTRCGEAVRRDGVERHPRRRIADSIYAKIEAFADFGFAESHSISFALIVYASAWMRLHYPGTFLAALLRAQPMGFYSPQSLIADARRHGVEVLRPDIRGRWRRDLEPLDLRPSKGRRRAAVARSLRGLGSPRRPGPSCLDVEQPPVGLVRPDRAVRARRAPPGGAHAVRLGLAEVRHRHEPRGADRRRAGSGRTIRRHERPRPTDGPRDRSWRARWRPARSPASASAGGRRCGTPATPHWITPTTSRAPGSGCSRRCSRCRHRSSRSRPTSGRPGSPPTATRCSTCGRCGRRGVLRRRPADRGVGPAHRGRRGRHPSAASGDGGGRHLHEPGGRDGHGEHGLQRRRVAALPPDRPRGPRDDHPRHPRTHPRGCRQSRGRRVQPARDGAKTSRATSTNPHGSSGCAAVLSRNHQLLFCVASAGMRSATCRVQRPTCGGSSRTFPQTRARSAAPSSGDALCASARSPPQMLDPRLQLLPRSLGATSDPADATESAWMWPCGSPTLFARMPDERVSSGAAHERAVQRGRRLCRPPPVAADRACGAPVAPAAGAAALAPGPVRECRATR